LFKNDVVLQITVFLNNSFFLLNYSSCPLCKVADSFKFIVSVMVFFLLAHILLLMPAQAHIFVL